MKIIHLVYQSWPNSAGSSIRTENILRAQRNAGLEVHVISAPGQAANNPVSNLSSEKYQDTLYHRTHLFPGSTVGQRKSLLNRVGKIIAFPYFIWRVIILCHKEKPNILHAHAMFYCGIAALVAGRLFNIPVTYEVRSLWYNNSHAGLSQFPRYIGSKLERFVVRRADAFVGISNGIIQAFKDIREDGVVVRNAIFKEDIRAMERLPSIRRIKSFGYIGSVIDLEGLDFVIEAFSRIKHPRNDFEFHIIGDGSALTALKQLAIQLDVPVHFHGRVPFSDIDKYYALIDCVINYRRDEPVAHDVTPLKPLEAIAAGKLLVCSDVRGMTEILDGRDNAIIIPANDITSLVKVISQLIRGEIDTYLIKQRAVQFVLANRSWEANGQAYIEIYHNILDKK
ncbi:glycosyltransferase family 4 protein [Nitrosomonas sp.]|uniref:glycosyltransferase family 4 protein n=1 Tax=Nitrosomonas sp. TaxID=42353 RepID=UPI0037C704AB